MRSSFPRLALSALATSTILSGAAMAETPVADNDGNTLTEILVVGARQADATPTTENIKPNRLSAADAASLASGLPGGALINNGALSGQVQFRGLTGDRVDVTVDGQRFGSGGPNLMDPPLPYAPLPLLSRLEISRSVGSVSKGPGLAGSVNAVYKKVDFSDGDSAQMSGDISATGRSADESVSLGGILGAATDRWRVQVLGSYEDGGNMRFPGGRIANSFHKRSTFGTGLGWRSEDGTHEVALDYRHQHVGATGNPPFAMDIEFFDSNFARAKYKGTYDSLSLEASVGYVDINHAMTNYLSRPAPSMMMQRRSTAEAETWTADLKLVKETSIGDIRFGGDFEDNLHNVAITTPNNPDFLLNNFDGIRMKRAGAYVEWYRDMGQAGYEAGVRFDHYSSKTDGASVGSAVPAMPAMLAMAFNKADTNVTHDLVDIVLQGWYSLNDKVKLRGTLARKNRAPGYVEQYAWLPTTASGGLADGNIYVGDLNLKAETAYVAEVGADYASDRFYARPTFFYRDIKNFIQGVPYDNTPGVVDSMVEMVAAMNGDMTPLRFANVDAKLYGFDMDMGLTLTQHLHMDGSFSYVRGKRKDINDNLYRIAPARGTVSLTYEGGDWYVRGESRLVAAQDKVSATNSEARTAGYAIFNLYAGWWIGPRVKLTAGVENLFNRYYEDHLAGYNRISNSDVALGARLPGAGTNAFLSVEYSF